ncbi:MAG: hypothetical protein IPL04_02670 [Chitinophagaceae bacterium]|nr:hypothetical protein [Chitinophagaceae bacterium]
MGGCLLRLFLRIAMVAERMHTELSMMKKFPVGYSSIWEVSHYGHKMSGLVVKREGMLESYISNPQWRNLYLFIYFLAYNQIKYPGIFAAKYKVLVNNYNKKDFNYNSIGLLDEVFKSYNYLIGVYGIRKVIKLLLRFVIIHSYRITFTKGFSLLIKQWRKIYKGMNLGESLSGAYYEYWSKNILSRIYIYPLSDLKGIKSEFI